MHELGVAVVGAGYWGPNLVRNFLASSRCDLRWVCDLDPERAARVVGRYSTVRTTTALDDLLDDPSVDAIAVSTPASTHADVVLRCLEADKHVLVEKPLASARADARKLVDAAEERGLTLMCDHTYCYTPAVQRMRELVRDGTLGDIHYIDSVRINLGLVQSDIDVFWDLAPHDLSILDTVLPEGCRPTSVAATGSDPIAAGHACVGYLSLQMASGTFAHTHVNWLSPVKMRTTIVGGSRRTLVWDDLQPAQRLMIYDRGVDMEASAGTDQRRQALISYRTGDMIAPALTEKEALASVVDEFVDAIEEGRQPLTDGWAGLRVLEVLEAARRSLQQGGAMVTTGSEKLHA